MSTLNPFAIAQQQLDEAAANGVSGDGFATKQGSGRERINAETKLVGELDQERPQAVGGHRPPALAVEASPAEYKRGEQVFRQQDVRHVVQLAGRQGDHRKRDHAEAMGQHPDVGGGTDQEHREVQDEEQVETQLAHHDPCQCLDRKGQRQVNADEEKYQPYGRRIRASAEHSGPSVQAMGRCSSSASAR